MKTARPYTDDVGGFIYYKKMAEQAAHGQALAQVAALEAVQELQWGAFSKAERLLRLRAERECT